MVKICAALNCLNNSISNNNLTWFPFPKVESSRASWIKLLGIRPNNVRPDTRVCSDHFCVKDFLTNSKKFLKADAIPSLKLVRVVQPAAQSSVQPDNAKLDTSSDIEVLDDEIQVIKTSVAKPVSVVKASPRENEPKKLPIPKSKPQLPVVEPRPTIQARPSRQAARAAAEKIQKTVQKYGLFEGNEDDEEIYIDEPDNDDADDPDAFPTKKGIEPPKLMKKSTGLKLLPKQLPLQLPDKKIISATLPVSQKSINLSAKPVTVTVSAKTPQIMSTKTPTVTTVKPVTPSSTAKASPSVTITPVKQTVTASKPAPVSRKPDTVTRVFLTSAECNLQLECEDDSLSLAQVDHFRTLFQAYEKFERKLEAANRAKDVRVIHCTGNELPPVTPPTIINNPPTPQVPAATSNQNVVITPQQPRLPNNSVLQPGMMITGSGQVLHSLGNQQIVFASPGNTVNTNNSTNTKINPPIQYKVLIDSRTGVVVGTLPNDAVIHSPPVTIAPKAKPSAQITTVSHQAPLSSTLNASTIAASNTVMTSAQAKSIKEGFYTDYEHCLQIAEGKRVVTAQSLLSIRVITPLTVAKEFRDLQKLMLKEYLEKEQYSTEPLKWWLKLGIFDSDLNCRCGLGKLSLVNNKLSIDGYSWQCNRGARCGFTAPVTRMIFFSRFGASLSKLHRLIYHWAAQSDALEAIHDSHVDIYMIRAVWRGIQDVCTRALNLKAEKIGGPNRILELATVRIGHHFVFCIMDRKSMVSRMKAVSDPVALSLPPIAIKTIEPWLLPKSIIMTSDPKMCDLGKKGNLYVHVDPKSSDDYKSIRKANAYVRNVLGTMFGQFAVSHLKQDTIQGFLDELQWRDRFGKAPKAAFWNIMKDIAEQSGKKVTVPNQQLNQVQIMSSCSSGSDSENSSQDASDDIRLIHESLEPKKIAAKPSTPQAPQKVTSPPVEHVRSVELTSFYYAYKNGDESEPDSNTYHFKCLICAKVLDNNIKMMKHLVAHIESTRQKNPDLSDLTQCKYCYRDFDTPYSMQCHMETVHLGTNDLSCKICNLALSYKRNLVQHMVNHHVQSEMPYICEVCNYRSSFQQAVIEHFHQAHNGTCKLLCHYCLKSYTVKSTATGGPGNVQNYYHHLYRHQYKSSQRKCNSCCLVYLSVTTLKLHRNKDHASMADVEGVIPVTLETETPIMIEPHGKKHRNAISGKAFNRKPPPIKIKRKTLSSSEEASILNPSRTLLLSLKELVTVGGYTCVECNSKIGLEHFSKVVQCSKCRYSTHCIKSFVEHMIEVHSNNPLKRRDSPLKPYAMMLDDPMFCACGFSSLNADRLSTHLVGCKYKTVYSSAESASAALMKIKLEPQDPTCEVGSAFFAPLVVLDDNEEEFVNSTLSKIPEPQPSTSGESLKRKLPPTSSKPLAKVQRAASEQEERPAAMLNALGLVRRRSDQDNDAEAPPLLMREDEASNKIQFEDRQGPSRNTRGVRSVLRARSNDLALNKEIMECMAEMEVDMEDPPLLEPENA